MRLTALFCVTVVSAVTSTSASGLFTVFGADDDDATTATDVDCVMGPWSKWSKCSAPCDCGLSSKVRVAITEAKGKGKACPYDEMAMTCNCKECTADQPKPAASAHGYVPARYKPDGGFSTKDAEQGACVLDKTAAIIELYLATKDCTKWDGKIGEQCYGKSAEHLVQHMQSCCAGRDHYKQWQSDVLCARLTASLVKEMVAVIVPVMEKCVGSGDCAALKTRHTFHVFAKIGMHGLKAAQELYARGKVADVTQDAAGLLHACDVNGKLEDASGRVIETWASPETAKCETHVADYVRSWRTTDSFKIDEENHVGSEEIFSAVTAGLDKGHRRLRGSRYL